MNLFKKYITLAVMLILLLGPSVIQLVHTFDDHHHEAEVCTSKNDQHFHEYEVECEICTFHFNSFTLNEIPLLVLTSTEEVIFSNSLYNSFKGSFILSFLLRGPPSF
ncbi:hypothetical protein [Tenacibaculum agarivorans]|uniref:hypothetical protein n=1 Tax=Tenacibaculum agarivorans TaxID=1908389 RepID=UPI00094B9990|nr:hypothetical protein [Tenacibaculum agarivorans]